MEICGLTNIV